MKLSLITRLTLLTGVCALALPALARADDAARSGKTGSMDKTASVETIPDVETLNDNLGKYSNKRISVKGEVKNLIDKRSLVVESGGILDDEIVVLAADDVKAKQLSKLKKDMMVKVTGTLRTASIMDVRQEYSWDLDPQVEVEFEGVTAYLVADKIEPLEAPAKENKK